MALEAWAHQRIDAGEPFDKVLADILGRPDTPAAHLLIAVDLLLSHWPKSREAAIPFPASPELLCLDRERYVHDNLATFDFDPFGLKALQKEPVGAASIESLKKRPSRHSELYDILSQYAAYGPPELRARLKELLRQAAERLGQPTAQSTLADPALMAQHALNVIDPANWRDVVVEREDGSQVTARQYVSPEAETRHFQPLQSKLRDQTANANMQLALAAALKDRTRSSQEFAASAVQWAKTTPTSTSDEDAEKIRNEAVVTSAMIAMRDGTPELRNQEETWALGVFRQALGREEDPVARLRSGLQFNPIAIAFAGMIHLLRDRTTPEDFRVILEVPGRGTHAAAHGFASVATVLDAMDQRLPRAVLRCVFAASVRPFRDWDLSDEQIAARAARQQQRMQDAIEAEMAWLSGHRSEPNWPAFPATPGRRRPGIRLPGGSSARDERETPASPPVEYVDYQAAALWLRSAASLVDVTKRPWLRELVRTYDDWTSAANGAGLAPHDRIDHAPTEWNDAYFDLLARCLPGLPASEIDSLAVAPIIALPDQPFFDAASQFLRSLDAVYFSDHGLQAAEAVHVRSALIQRLIATSGFRSLAGKRASSIEIHIGPAIAVCFFNDYHQFQPARAYLLPRGVDRLAPFLPELEKLALGAPCPFVALVTLNLLEVCPRPQYLQFIVTAARAWMGHFPDDSGFWCDLGLGRRICALIEKIREQQLTLLAPGEPMRFQVEEILACLIRCGVAEASRLETALAIDS